MGVAGGCSGGRGLLGGGRQDWQWQSGGSNSNGWAIVNDGGEGKMEDTFKLA